MADSTPPVSSRPEPSRAGSWRRLALAAGVGALALAWGWQWYDGRSQLGELRDEVARRLRDSDTESRDARLVARQTEESLREAQAKLAQLEVKLAETRNQQNALEALYHEVSRNRDDWVLAETEQILTIAAQQLQLAGNVKAALAALQTADARLARPDRPQFAPLRRALAHDIERLKSAPAVDISGMAAKLDQLIATVDSLPLAQDARPPAHTEPAGTREERGWWAGLVSELLDGLKQLIRVENVERADPVLLNPSQKFFLRENLKLRLLDARLALLARDESAFRSDVKIAAGWLERYFDARSRGVASDSAVLRQLGAEGAGMSVPTIGESLSAVHGYKASRERAAR
jgi:uroporphyrin-3 C-methyltransferase